MGLDARVRYTKKVIEESFISLIEEKPFHSITLKEVCERAEINRSTFYKHYRDIYDWKAKLERFLLDEEASFISSCRTEDITGILCQQFENMRKDPRLYRTLCSPNFESDIMGQMLSVVLEATDEETRKYYDTDKDNDYIRRWDVHYVIKGCLGAMECWVQEGMKEEPMALAEFFAGKIYSSGAQPRTS